MESATRRASFEINVSPYMTLGTSRQLRPRIKKSYTGDVTIKSKGDNTKSKVGKNGDDVKSKFCKKGDNAKSKIVKNIDSTKSKAGGPAAESRKKSSKKILRESNPIVAVVYPISKGKGEWHNSELSDGKKGVEVDMDMKAMKKGQENNSDIKSVAMRGDREKEEDMNEENKENARPKRTKRDNVRLSGYAKKWSL